jgi:hypothetical protein
MKKDKEKVVEMIVERKVLLDTLRSVEYAASRDTSRFGLNCVLFHGNAKKIVATDGHRLSSADAEWLPEGLEVLISVDNIYMMMKHLKASKSEKTAFKIEMPWAWKPVKEAFSGRMLCAGSVYLDGELMGVTSTEDYPDYQKVMPQDLMGVIPVSRQTILEWLKPLMQSQKARKEEMKARFPEITKDQLNDFMDKVTPSVQIQLKTDRVIFTYHAASYLENHSLEIMMSIREKGLRVVNAAYFYECIQHLTGEDTISIQFSVNEKGPIQFNKGVLIMPKSKKGESFHDHLPAGLSTEETPKHEKPIAASIVEEIVEAFEDKLDIAIMKIVDDAAEPITRKGILIKLLEDAHFRRVVLSDVVERVKHLRSNERLFRYSDKKVWSKRPEEKPDAFAGIDMDKPVTLNMESPVELSVEPETVPKKRGRKPGSKNKPKVPQPEIEMPVESMTNELVAKAGEIYSDCKRFFAVQALKVIGMIR